MSAEPAPPVSRPDDERSTLAKIRRRTLPLIFLGSLMAYLDRVNIGYAQLGMAKDLGITAAAYGFAAAVFFITYCVCEIPSNLFLARFGARIWMTRIMVTWGIITVLTGFVQDETQLYIARFLLGVAEAGLFPGMILYMTTWFRARDRALSFSALVIAQPIAFLLGGLGSGVVLDHVHWFGLDPWQWVFILTGIPPVLLGIVFLALLPDSPAKAPWMTPAETERLESDLAAEAVGEVAHGWRAQLQALKSPQVLHLALINLVTSVGFYGFNLFVPLILKQLNPSYSATNIGYLAVLPYGCAVLGLIVFAMVGKHITRIRLLNIVLTLVSATGITGIIVFRDQPAVAVAFLTLMATSCFIFVPSIWALFSNALSRTHVVVGTATINSFSAIGGFIGPYLVGQAATGSRVTGGLFTPLVGLLLGTALLLLWRGRSTPAPVQESLGLSPQTEPVV